MLLFYKMNQKYLLTKIKESNNILLTKRSDVRTFELSDFRKLFLT